MNKLIDLKRINIPSAKQNYRYSIDIVIVIGLAIAIAIAIHLGTYQIPDPIFTDFYAQDVWFGSDIPTVFGNITSFDSDFGRNNKHPLFPLFVFPIVFGLGKILSLDPLSAARLVAVLVAVSWVGSLYALFRLMGCQRLDSTLFSILGGVSAASMFWLVTPESFSFGSVTILLGLIFVVLTQYQQLPMGWYVAVNIVTVSITITNAMVGIFATLINQRWQRVIKIGVISLLMSTALWVVQRILFTNSGFPFQPGTFIGEKKFVTVPEKGGVLAAISSFFYQTMVMPAVEFIDSPIRPDWIKLDVNTLNPISGSWMGGIAVFAWTGLLLLGFWGLFSIKQHVKLRLVLGLTLVAQLLMHSVYGLGETFIYTLHFAPLLLTLAALSLFTRLRLLSLGLVVILIVSAGVTNRIQFNRVTATLGNYGTPHQQLETQMKLRPSDPWVRSAGHVLLASPGSAVESKAFYEPGGSFSPEPGSFGVSIWAIDRQGNLKATSDSIPLNEIQQQFVDVADQAIPGIATRTAYYNASWTVSAPGNWRLAIDRVPTGDTKTAVVIRSVGPAGGAIQKLNWDGQRLLINDRWAIKNLPASVKVQLGDERSPGWMRQNSTATQWQDERGWGYARLENGAGNWTVEIEDLSPVPTAIPALAEAGAKPVFNLPDPQFAESLNAQIAHLRMGVVGNQTRPGDPIDYPLPRFREGAYELVALARTGHLETARQLVPYFAATDFTNGTQPAADIPALGIWAITEVAQQINKLEYNQSIWADVYRKAELVVDLLASNRPGYPIFKESAVPFSEYSDLVRVDLIAGKMDAIPGLIALDPAANFMAYRALLNAATLADRLKKPEIASRWRSQATQLQNTWRETFNQIFAGVDATYTSGLWPSGLATANQAAFVEGLENRWNNTHDEQGILRQLPNNTNVDVAEAHQWLYLNRPDRVWSTLQWFWQHQASPGLYTWWGDRGGNSGVIRPESLSQWHRFRGWINAPHSTPDYWTAAEMVLLQLDMLAYVNPTPTNPTLVIGAGIPQKWLTQPFSIKNLPAMGNIVSWDWDGKQVTVTLQGEKVDIQLGKLFPENTPLKVNMSQK